ncbi:hypothetical protein BZL30_0550 [Mycobacterium kansasii]|uniref:Uncharacterized protein n=1 Tax=Mycobacterium kansasii TaxID=1768 RepID=A0A1V3XVF2_MYCKA|nr:hypothetical protein BZL30_0550 [Mycobacterium kansasii]OOK83217.1 hypothetical protein BZL29_1293 [Mycobacterium kansasii]
MALGCRFHAYCRAKLTSDVDPCRAQLRRPGAAAESAVADTSTDRNGWLVGMIAS